MVNVTKQKRVLIVDDEDLTRTLLSQVLERANVGPVEVFMAEDGPQALKIAEDERPDLILLDLLLPRMNGYDVCREIRAIAGYDPHIIILTARGQNTDRQQAKSFYDETIQPIRPHCTAKCALGVMNSWRMRNL